VKKKYVTSFVVAVQEISDQCYCIIVFRVLHYRLAFCDIFLGKLLLVYYMDLVCDGIMLIDMGFALVTVVPKVYIHTHTQRQIHAHVYVTHVYTCMCTHVYTYTSTHAQTYT